MTEDLLYELRDGIGYVTFNRPQARNALTFAMYERLAEICKEAPEAGVRALLLTLGLVPALLVVVYYLFALSLDPLSAAWYLLLLVTGHSVGVATTILGCLLLGAACGAVEIAWRTPAEEPAPPREGGPSVYGPGAYAGPGSLGGTSSALRR